MSIIRGHYVYKSIWSSNIGETIFTAPETNEEVKQYVKFLISVYKDANHKILVGHLPIETLSFSCHFFNRNKENQINVSINRKRQEKVGLVVPAKFCLEKFDKTCAEILERTILKRRELFSSLKFKKNRIY